MFLNQRLLLPLLLHVILVSFASEKAPRSSLQLFPNKGFEFVSLGHSYHHMTEEEKNNSVFLKEGCYTILNNNQEGHFVLTGPFSPCQFLCLSINGNTVVANICPQSNLSALLILIKARFPNYDASKITGELFTTEYPEYNNPIFNLNEQKYSWKDRYEGRLQIEELRYNKTKIINILEIPDRNQIKAFKFNSKKKSTELGNYELAELFLFVLITAGKPAIFNTCPMAEKYFIKDLKDIPLAKLVELNAIATAFSPNPFMKQKNGSDFYASTQFCYVPNTSDN